MGKADSYLRLMEYASRVMKVTGEAEVAREITRRGYALSPQTLNNWGRRGIPDAASLQIGKAIGMNPLALFFDEYHFAPSDQPAAQDQKIADTLEVLGKPLIGYSATPIQQNLKVTESDPDERLIIEAYRVADPAVKRMILAIAREAKAAFEKRSEQNN